MWLNGPALIAGCSDISPDNMIHEDSERLLLTHLRENYGHSRDRRTVRE
jgi:hypothetical protein